MKFDSNATRTAPDASLKPGLCNRALDNLVQVTNCGRRVVIRLTRDNLSGPAKTLFIRHLAATGFIPDRYQGYSEVSNSAALDVQWIVDGCWARLGHGLRRQAARVFALLTGGKAQAAW